MEPLHVFADLLDCFVGDMPQLLGHGRIFARWLVTVEHQGPNTVQPAGDAVYPAVVPLSPLLPRPDEHQVHPYRVGAYLGDVVVGGDDTALGLAHLLPLGDDYPLVEQPGERLVEIHHAQIADGLHEKAGVQQVHGGVLGTAGVLVHRQPVSHLVRVGGAVPVARAAVAQEVPRGAHEGVHGVRLPPRRGAAGGARGVNERFAVLQRRLSGRAELGVLRQQHRQVFLRHRHQAALIAVNHGYGGAPVALAGDEPVSQAVAHLPPAVALLLHEIGYRLDPLPAGHAAEAVRVDHGARLGIGLGQLLPRPSRRRDDHLYRYIELFSELEVALVVGRDRHHRAGAVAQQHVVGDPDGHPLPV